MLDLRRLRLLRDLDRLGTVTAVARSLSYSPSAVSQQLDALEREAGIPLLEPAGRRVRLTAAGCILVRHAQALLDEMERAEAALAETRDAVAGTIRVAAFHSAVRVLLPAVVAALQRDHPALRVEITELESDVALPALLSGAFDVVIGEEYPGRPLERPRAVQRQDLFEDPLRLVTPASWGVQELRDLRERPFIMEPPGTTARDWAFSTCRVAGFEPDVRHTTTDLQLHLEFARAGLAAALLPDLAGAGGGRLAVRALPGRPARTVFLCIRNGTGNRPACRAVIDTLRCSGPAQEPADEGDGDTPADAE